MDETRHPEGTGAGDSLPPDVGPVDRRHRGSAGLSRASRFAGVAA
jgi:hypothetical protein